MAFELLYALKGKKFWWIDIVLYFFVAFLAITIIFYFVLDIGISAQRQKIERLSQNIEKFGIPEQKEIEKEVYSYQKKINEVSKLVKSHRISSNFFKLTEQIIFPKVYFSTLALSIENSRAQFTGKTEDFESLSKQLVVLEEDKNIKSIEAFGAKLGEEAKVMFDLTLSLSPELFLWK